MISLNPVKTKFLRSSHPIPPAPTTRIFAVLTLVPSSDSNTGFVILETILPCLIQTNSTRIKSKAIVKLIFQKLSTYVLFFFFLKVLLLLRLRVGDLPVKKIFQAKLYHDICENSFVQRKIDKNIHKDVFLCKNLPTALSMQSEIFLTVFRS